MATLIDVNLGVALLYGQHRHSAHAQTWLENQSELASIRVCRVVQLGVIRLFTNKTVMGADVLTPPEAFHYWNQAMSDSRFLLTEEPTGVESIWNALAADLPSGSCADNDTYLAAFAIAAGLTLATFDRGFQKYPGLRLELLGT